MNNAQKIKEGSAMFIFLFLFETHPITRSKTAL